jgi:hypothetical protein
MHRTAQRTIQESGGKRTPADIPMAENKERGRTRSNQCADCSTAATPMQHAIRQVPDRAK